jgi:SAM-dependent methyltransferase
MSVLSYHCRHRLGSFNFRLSTPKFTFPVNTHRHFISSPAIPEEMPTEMKDTKKLWQAGMAERYVNAENATRPFAKILIEKAGLPTLNKNAHVFDLGTGTGAAIQELYDAVPKEKWGDIKVLGGDVSESMLDHLKARGEKAGWTGLETKVLDGNVSPTFFFTPTHPYVLIIGAGNQRPRCDRN